MGSDESGVSSGSRTTRPTGGELLGQLYLNRRWDVYPVSSDVR
jgi:hypothetical protein